MDIFPLIEKDFITKDAIAYLMKWIKLHENFFDEHQNPIEYWNNKCINFGDIREDGVKKALEQICFSMKKLIVLNTPRELRKLYVEYPQLVRWRPKDKLTPHADNIEQDGITPNSSPWRQYGAVLYLNNDFEGGKIYYPNLDMMVNPEPGMIVIHPADLKYTHGVSEVTSGFRYTMVTFFTFNHTYGMDDGDTIRYL